MNNDEIKQIILKYYSQGIKSVRKMCEKLIKHYNLPDERYQTGKPMIYYKVCKLMEECGLEVKVLKGLSRENRIKKANRKDRIYERIDT